VLSTGGLEDYYFTLSSLLRTDKDHRSLDFTSLRFGLWTPLSDQLRKNRAIDLRRSELCMFIYTIFIYAIYLISDLEDSDNGDPLNGIICR
jgi:hypothetical protein